MLLRETVRSVTCQFESCKVLFKKKTVRLKEICFFKHFFYLFLLIFYRFFLEKNTMDRSSTLTVQTNQDHKTEKSNAFFNQRYLIYFFSISVVYNIFLALFFYLVYPSVLCLFLFSRCPVYSFVYVCVADNPLSSHLPMRPIVTRR
jgi:hypothetical protein